MSIGKNEFQKSLAKLQDLTKGTQLFHTASNSNPSEWEGGEQEDLDEHGGDIHIDDNGTDYNGVRKSLAAKVRKSLALTPAEVAIAEGKNPLPAISNKISKGQKLTSAEEWAIKGGYDADKDEFLGMNKASTMPSPAGKPGEQDDANSAPASSAGAKMDESEVEGDAKKSFNGAVSTSLELQKGIEASPFLFELTKAIGAALEGSESRVVKSVTNAVTALVARVDALEKSTTARASDLADFNKSLAQAVVGIGEIVGGASDAGAHAANAPVGAPKSQLTKGGYDGSNQINVIEKSYNGPGGLDMNMSKSQICETMVDMVKGGQLAANEVIKFEHTGEILPSTQKKVAAYLNGKN